MKNVIVALDPVTTSLASHVPRHPPPLCHTPRPLPVAHSVCVFIRDLAHQPEVLSGQEMQPAYHYVMG